MLVRYGTVLTLGMAGTAGRAPVVMIILSAAIRSPSTSTPPDEVPRALVIGDAVISRQQIEILRLPKTSDELVLLAYGRPPVVDRRLGRDAGEAGGNACIVQRLRGPDQRLRISKASHIIM